MGNSSERFDRKRLRLSTKRKNRRLAMKRRKINLKLSVSSEDQNKLDVKIPLSQCINNDNDNNITDAGPSNSKENSMELNSAKSMSSLEEESEPDVPDLVPVHQPTDVDESTEVEIKEEPLKRENDLPTSDIHEEPSSDIYEESTSDIHEESTSDIHEEPPTLPLLPIIKEEPLDQPANISPETVEPQKKVEQISELGRQSIQMFFDSMAKTVMTLPPSFVSRIKSEVLRVVSNMEMEAIGEQMKEPIRTPENLTAASTVTEPRIKIENVDDEEAEASDELDQPELLDPESLDLDHDENYEPLAKKKKKSQADQPTPSSSALQVRTPRTQHEPVETFFQSVACTVTSFPRPFVCKAKVAVLKVISKMEVEVCSSRQLGYQDGGGGGDGSSTRHLLASGSNY
ncbi:unnamed protein product [Ceutorhynchus assimilis]|uniref:Uncharacterized protein n=1 Tax=Ceutorhynchus assimilis TaxID=467358 RepID=A0A9P0DLC2_9CUCU|nr:unnamed protein product [Ceutorhynchus assimilis]